ncbi:MAG: hypothetical protein WBA88_13585, partial [Pseudaminobacter sp.]
MGRIYTAFLAANFALFGWVFSGAASEIRSAELLLLGFSFLLILGVQSLIAGAIYALVRYIASPGLVGLTFKLVLGLLVAANVYYLGMIPLEAPFHLKLLYSALAGLAFLTVVLLPLAVVKPAIMFAGIFGVLSVGQYAYGRATMTPESGFRVTSKQFKNNRNIYFISFESLHSPKAYRELYKIKDLPHISYLKDKGFRVFDSAYSVDTATRTSYMRILEFGRDRASRRVALSRGNSTFKSFRDSN